MPQGIQCQLCHLMFNDQSAISAHYDTAHAQSGRNKASEGTFECEVCGKKVTRKPSLLHHMAIAHGMGDVTMFQCDICSRTFNKKANLRAHVKNVHKLS